MVIAEARLVTDKSHFGHRPRPSRSARQAKSPPSLRHLDRDLEESVKRVSRVLPRTLGSERFAAVDLVQPLLRLSDNPAAGTSKREYPQLVVEAASVEIPRQSRKRDVLPVLYPAYVHARRPHAPRKLCRGYVCLARGSSAAIYAILYAPVNLWKHMAQTLNRS